MQHTRLTRMSKNQLHNTLLKRNYSPARIKEIKEWVEKKKAWINRVRVEKQVRQRRWREFIRPLSYHIATVKTNKTYYKHTNPALFDFYTDYINLLETTRGKLTLIKNQRTVTPIQHDKDKKDWTDYIDTEEKERLVNQYNSIPYPSKFTHRRELFPKPNQNRKGTTK